MSHSPENQQPRLRVFGDADSELYVLDSALEKKGYAVGMLDAHFPPGLYKVRAVRAGATVERLIDLQKDERIDLEVTPQTAIAPVGPVYGRWWQEIQALADRAFQRLAPGSKREGEARECRSRILFLAHCSGTGLPDPIRELRVSPWGNLRERWSAEDALLEKVIGDEHWGAWAISMEPGCYQIDMPQTGLRQTLLVVRNFDTRVFIRRVPTGNEGENIGADETGAISRTELSIQMAEPNSTVCYSDHYETIEIARRAMETERPIIVGDYLIDNLLHEKWDNPVMGVMGAHLFLAALERDRANRETPSNRSVDLSSVGHDPRSVLVEVLDNLDKVLDICPGSQKVRPSDLIALRLRAAPFTGEETDFGTVDHPPMFWAGWEALLKASVPGGPVAISRRLWSRIAQAYPSGPYFGWRRGNTSLDRQIDALISAQGDSYRSHVSFAPATLWVGRVPDAKTGLRAREISSDLAKDVATTLGAPLSLLVRN